MLKQESSESTCSSSPGTPSSLPKLYRIFRIAREAALSRRARLLPSSSSISKQNVDDLLSIAGPDKVHVVDVLGWRYSGERTLADAMSVDHRHCARLAVDSPLGFGMNELTFRRLARADFDELAGWLAAPLVARHRQDPLRALASNPFDLTTCFQDTAGRLPQLRRSHR